MQHQPTFSRRKAATFAAGALAAATSAARVTTLAPASATPVTLDLDFGGLLAQSHRRMIELLASVRDATGETSRGRAFDRFKTAFALHDHADSLVSAVEGSDHAALRPDSLYRQEEPAKVLARVIVAELHAWPKADAAWSRRFVDLETALRNRTA